MKMEELNGERCDAFLSTPIKCFLWLSFLQIHSLPLSHKHTHTHKQNQLLYLTWFLWNKILFIPTWKYGVWCLHAALLRDISFFSLYVPNFNIKHAKLTEWLFSIYSWMFTCAKVLHRTQGFIIPSTLLMQTTMA